MYIRTIQLRNGYKRFKDLTIDLGEENYKIVALVGPNGSGKSSVFDGMLYLQAKYGHIGQTQIGDVNYHSMENDPNYDSKWQDNVKIRFNTGEFEPILRTKEGAGNGRTIFSFRSPYRYSSNLSISRMEQMADIKLNNSGAGGTIFIDQKVTDNYQRLYRDEFNIYLTNTQAYQSASALLSIGRILLSKPPTEEDKQKFLNRLKEMADIITKRYKLEEFVKRNN